MSDPDNDVIRAGLEAYADQQLRLMLDLAAEQLTNGIALGVTTSAEQPAPCTEHGPSLWPLGCPACAAAYGPVEVRHA